MQLKGCRWYHTMSPGVGDYSWISLAFCQHNVQIDLSFHEGNITDMLKALCYRPVYLCSCLCIANSKGSKATRFTCMKKWSPTVLFTVAEYQHSSRYKVSNSADRHQGAINTRRQELRTCKGCVHHCCTRAFQRNWHLCVAKGSPLFRENKSTHFAIS